MWSISRAGLRQFASRTPRSLLNRPKPVASLSLRYYSDDNEGRPKIALVIGSSGALGSAVSRHLSRNAGMTVLGADVVELPPDSSDLDGFITLPTMDQRPSVADVTTQLALGIHETLREDQEIDAIVVASGGWAGDPKPISKRMAAEELVASATEYGETIDQLMYMNLIPVIAAGYSAQTFMGPNGLFVVIGATAALTSTPGMLGYGMSKAASHHIVHTIGATTGNSLEAKAKRAEGRIHREFAANLSSLSVVGILPTTIDTPSNRQAMHGTDTSNWTKPRDIAEEIGRWVETPLLRPHSGALVRVASSAEGSIFDIVR